MPGEAHGLREALTEAGREVPVQSLNQIGVKKVRVLKASNIESLVEDVVTRMFDEREQRIAKEHNERLEAEILAKQELLAETDASSKRASQLAEEIESLRSDRSRLEEEFRDRQASWEQEKAGLIESTNRDVKQRIRELQEARAETDKTREQLKLTETAKAELVDRLTAIATGHEENERQWNDERTGIESRLKESLNRVASLTADLTERDETIAALERKLDKATADHEAGISELRDKLDSLGRKSDEARTSSEARESALRQQVDDLTRQLADTRDNLETEVRQREDLGAIRSDLENDVRRLEEELAAERELLKTLRADRDNLNGQLEGAEAAGEELRLQLQSAGEREKALKEILGERRSEVDDLTGRLENAEDRAEKLSEGKRAALEKVSFLEKELEQEHSTRESLTEQLGEVRDNLQAEETIRLALQEQRDDLESELKRRDKLERKASEERTRLERDIARLNEALGSLEIEHVETGQRLAALKIDRDRRISELERLLTESRSEVANRDERLGAAASTESALRADVTRLETAQKELGEELATQKKLLEGSESLARHRLQELETLRREHSGLGDRFAALQGDFHDLGRARKQLGKSVEELTRSRDSLQEKVGDMTRRLENLLASVDTLEAARDDLAERLSGSESLNRDLEAQRDRLRRDIQELRDKGDLRETELVREVEEGLSQLEALAEELETATERNRQLGLEKAGAQLACDAARREGERLRSELVDTGEALRIEKDRRNSERETLEIRIANQEQELKRVTADNDGFVKEISRLEQLERLLQAQVTELGRDLDTSNRDGEAARLQLEEIREQHRVQVDTASSLTGEVRRLSDELALSEQNLDETRSLLTGRQTELARQATRFASLREERDDWKTRAEDLTSVTEELRQRLDTELATIDILSREKGDLADLCARHADDLAEARSELDGARTRAGVLSGRVQTLEADNTDLARTANRVRDLEDELAMLRSRNAEQERQLLETRSRTEALERLVADQKSGLKTLETGSRQWETRCREYQASWLEGKREIEKLRHALANSEDNLKLLRSDLEDFEAVQREHLVELRENDEELDILRLDRSRIEDEVATLTGTVNSLNAELASARRALDQRDDEITRQTAEINRFRFRLEGILAREIHGLLADPAPESPETA